MYNITCKYDLNIMKYLWYMYMCICICICIYNENVFVIFINNTMTINE
jgi:hypothetical protein